MSTTATVDTNEGWTFAGRSRTSEFPTTTAADNENTELPVNNDYGIAATTHHEWDAPPAAPSPPLSAVGQPRTDDHASLHWTACYDDYCNTHRQSKDNNYYPRNTRRRRRAQTCDCPLPHPNELLEVTRERHLNPVKACADWHRGKRVCPDCRFLVNMENHHLRCSAAVPRVPLADITPPQEAPAAAEENPEAEAAASPEDQIRLLAEIITTVQNTVIQEARHNYGIQRLLAQTMRDQHNADQRQLQKMARTLEAITAEQQRITERTRQQASRPIRIYRTPIHRHPATTRPDLAGASVWTGDLLSRTWRDRLVGAAAGAALTLATLWLILVSAATATVILRA